MQAPFHSPLLAMFQQDNGTMAAPLADGYGLRRRPVSSNQRFMPMAPFGIQPQTTGGYDSSGINPHGMYNGSFGQPQNPGGFQPMSLAGLLRQYA